jgi:hypothetical protein
MGFTISPWTTRKPDKICITATLKQWKKCSTGQWHLWGEAMWPCNHPSTLPEDRFQVALLGWRSQTEPADCDNLRKSPVQSTREKRAAQSEPQRPQWVFGWALICTCIRWNCLRLVKPQRVTSWTMYTSHPKLSVVHAAANQSSQPHKEMTSARSSENLN